MGSWFSAILILLLVCAGGYFYLRRANKLPSWLPDLFASNPEKTIESYKERTERALERQHELKRILEAKETYLKTKSLNEHLQKKITSAKSSPVHLSRKELEDLNAMNSASKYPQKRRYMVKSRKEKSAKARVKRLSRDASGGKDRKSAKKWKKGKRIEAYTMGEALKGRR